MNETKVILGNGGSAGSAFDIATDSSHYFNSNRLRFIVEGWGLNALTTHLFSTGKLLSPSSENFDASPVQSPGDNMSTYPDGNIKLSWLGMPVWANVILQYTDPNTNTTTSIDLQTVLLEVTQTRLIVKTALQGKDGTVKEYISEGDYNIEIIGGIFNQNPKHIQKMLRLH